MYETFEKTFPIGYTEVDTFGRIRPAALLGFFQDMATGHSALLDVGRDYLLGEYHAIWMLVRVWYSLKRPLTVGENLTIRTWHRGVGGLILYRDFDLLVDGETVGEAISAWVVADAENRKMLRPSSIANLAASPIPETVKDKQLKLIRTPKHKKPIYTKTVRFSDLDLNGHMNNTKYADVLLDALDPEALRENFVAEMQLNYSMECLAGESMVVSREDSDASCYIDGCGPDGERKFEAILQFQPDSAAGLDEIVESE
jgi:acyl-ACP thioesterase